MIGTKEQTERLFDSATDIDYEKGIIEEHLGELYHQTSILRGLNGFDAIDETASAVYRQQGFFAVENAFTPAEVADANDALAYLIMGGRPDFRGVQFEAIAADRLATMTLAERELAVRKLMSFVDYDARLRALAEHPALIAIVTRLLGATPQMFQDMALLKPPHIGREKPWHQDHAYFDYPMGTPIVGVWIALDEATVDNGCMHVLPGGHLAGPRPHFNRRDWQICDSEMLGTPCVAVPLAPGGLMLFDGLLPHGTPLNRSAARRRALQFHYAPASVAKIGSDERLAAFGSDGKNVSC